MRKGSLGGALEFYSAEQAGALARPAPVPRPTMSRSREAVGLLRSFSWIRKAQEPLGPY